MLGPRARSQRAGAIDTTITCTDDGTYTATLTADDGVNPTVADSTTVTVSNAIPSVSISAPGDLSVSSVNTAVGVTAPYSDAGVNDTHTCSVDWGDAVITPGARRRRIVLGHSQLHGDRRVHGDRDDPG